MIKRLEGGTSLIELLLYTAILATVLLVIYNLFLQSSLARLSSYNNNSIQTNARQVIFDLQQTIRRAQSVDSPAIGESAPGLSLNGGNIIYALDENKSLIKTEAGSTNRLTNSSVIVKNIIFQNLGPSVTQPTIKISFSLQAKAEEQGKETTEDFQTAVSLR